jgi:hypothetical protein
MNWTSGRSRFDPRQRQEDFSSSFCAQTGSGAHPASCTMGTGGPFSWVKCGRGVTLATHPPLVPRSWISRSNTSSSWASIGVLWDCFIFFTLLQFTLTQATCQGPEGTEHCGRVVNTPVSYSAGTGFKFRPGNRLAWLRFIVVFISPSRQMTGWCLKLGYDRFLPSNLSSTYHLL